MRGELILIYTILLAAIVYLIWECVAFLRNINKRPKR